MMRPATLILFGLAVVAGGTLFGVAFKVSELEERLAVLNKEIASDRDAVHVLRAEWSYLNQPDRLEGLSRRYLDLKPLEGGQMAAVATLPVRPLPELPDGKPAGTAGADTEPAAAQTPEAAVAQARQAIPKSKPKAPRRPTGNVQLVAQPASPPSPASSAAAETAALDAALRAILSNSAGGGRTR